MGWVIGVRSRMVPSSYMRTLGYNEAGSIGLNKTSFQAHITNLMPWAERQLHLTITAFDPSTAVGNGSTETPKMELKNKFDSRSTGCYFHYKKKASATNRHSRDLDSGSKIANASLHTQVSATQKFRRRPCNHDIDSVRSGRSKYPQ